MTLVNFFWQDRPTRKLCAELGIVYQAYSPLGALWTFSEGLPRNPVLSVSLFAGRAKEA